ncbi:MAG TPA: hypothetical protein VE783_02130 [Candidatus Limnocylindrales bacterium]|jgi:hypothetical protein|nr:hypothetical protein [Candidatus Limnocylindrales bacterium]
MTANISQASIAPAADVLNSWKEIACYLNRGVRTVQRWEAELGMPVRRPRNKSRSAVIAFRSDLDRWLRQNPAAEAGRELPVSSPGKEMVRRDDLIQAVHRCQSLCAEMQQTLTGFSNAVSEYRRTVQTLMISRGERPGWQPALQCNVDRPAQSELRRQAS